MSHKKGMWYLDDVILYLMTSLTDIIILGWIPVVRIDKNETEDYTARLNGTLGTLIFHMYTFFIKQVRKAK